MPQTVATALIINADKDIFVQRRSQTRRLFPNCWDLAGGHVDPGETVQEALAREVFEETGWSVATVLTELPAKTWQADDVARAERQFILTVDGDLAAPKLESGKVNAWRWIGRTALNVLQENRATKDHFVRDSVKEALTWLDANR